MRNPECQKYKQCLDRAVFENKAINCEHCPDAQVKPTDGEYPKFDHETEVVMEEKKHRGRPKGSKKNPIIQGQGPETAHTKPYPPEPIKTCRHCQLTVYTQGELEELFHKNPSCKGGYAHICKKCRNLQKIEAQKVLKAKKMADAFPSSELVITVDFNKWPDVYKRVQSEAEKNYRPVSMQIVAMVAAA